MVPTNVFFYTFFCVDRWWNRAAVGKQYAMHLRGAVAPCATHDNLIVLLVPFQYGARAYAQPLANLRRYTGLASSQKLGFCDCHLRWAPPITRAPAPQPATQSHPRARPYEQPPHCAPDL